MLINDSDITVSPRYLERVMALHAPASASGEGRKTGLVTALYRGRAHETLPSRLEALGIATDFQPSVLLARWIEGGLRYGLGSTLAVSREALESIGGLEPLVDHLADDYELGERIFKAGYAVALSRRSGGNQRPRLHLAGLLRSPVALVPDGARRAPLGLRRAGLHLRAGLGAA